MTRMLLTMTGSMARLSEEVREMRQAIDISNQQIAEFKQHIPDIKNQIIDYWSFDTSFTARAGQKPAPRAHA